MKGMRKMRANEKTIKDFVGGYDKVFLIPPFQRNYAWDKKNCQELWDDFENCTLSQSSHFLGNIIYFPSKNTGASYTELILVDGQQRLTTILLLLAALRDITDDEDLSKDIDEKYLKNSTKDERYRIKLKAITNDYEDFSKIVGKDTKNMQNSKMLDNYKFFCNKVANTKVELKKIFETIAKSEIVDINLQADNNLKLVQTIFEKINSTGKPLTSADLIRNLLLSSDSPDIQNTLYNNYWIQIEKTIGIDNVPDFVSDYLLIKTTQQSISNKEVYEKFKLYKTSSDFSNEVLLEDLLQYAKYYRYLITDSCPNGKIAKCIKEINILKASDILPALLLMLNRMYDNNQKELEKLFLLFSDFILRYRLVGDYSGGGALQGSIRQLMNKLIDGTIQFRYEDVLFELSNSSRRDAEFPIDDRFEEILKTKRFSNDEVKILLLRIECHNNKDAQVPYEKLTLEHIMPQSLTPKWRKYLGLDGEDSMKFHSEYLWKLGNLTLLSGSWNSSLSNKVYDEKKSYYKENQFKITRNIEEDFSSWGKESIENRGKKLARIAVEATISPGARTRPYQKESEKTYDSGQYFLSDEIKIDFTKLRSLIYKENAIECKHWNTLFALVCQIAFQDNPNKFGELAENDSKSKSLLISKQNDVFTKAQKIGGSDYYCEGNISSNSARSHALKVIKDMGLDESDFIIEIV